MRGILIFALASAAVAADNGGWIEHAGGTVTRDAAGKIVTVDLRSSWVTDSDMPRLAQLPDLKKLDLSLTRISDRGMRALKSAPAIEELNLYFAERVTDEGTAVIKGWKHLKRVNFRGTKMTDVTLEFLGGIPTIEAKISIDSSPTSAESRCSSRICAMPRNSANDFASTVE